MVLSFESSMDGSSQKPLSRRRVAVALTAAGIRVCLEKDRDVEVESVEARRASVLFFLPFACFSASMRLGMGPPSQIMSSKYPGILLPFPYPGATQGGKTSKSMDWPKTSK